MALTAPVLVLGLVSGVVDRKGIVRYRHFGEGAYDETEGLIRTLLEEEK